MLQSYKKTYRQMDMLQSYKKKTRRQMDMLQPYKKKIQRDGHVTIV